MGSPELLGTRLLGNPEDIEQFVWWISGLADRFEEVAVQLEAKLREIYQVWDDDNFKMCSAAVSDLVGRTYRRSEDLRRLVEKFDKCAEGLRSAKESFASADAAASRALEPTGPGYLEPDWKGQYASDQIRPPAGDASEAEAQQWMDYLRESTAWSQARTMVGQGIDAIAAPLIGLAEEEAGSWVTKAFQIADSGFGVYAKSNERLAEKLFDNVADSRVKAQYWEASIRKRDPLGGSRVRDTFRQFLDEDLADAARHEALATHAGLVAKVCKGAGVLFAVGEAVYEIHEGESIPRALVTAGAGALAGEVALTVGGFLIVEGPLLPLGLLCLGVLVFTASWGASSLAGTAYDAVIPKPAPKEVREDLASIGVVPG